MQPLVPYLLGKEHPSGNRLVDSQKCFRSGDIEEVGDNRHTTFFEMLGNWSLGDYGKEKQLPWMFTFLTEELGIDPERLYVTVFAGDESLGIPQDDESVAIWQDLFKEKGIDAKVAHMGSEEAGAERGMQEGERIFRYDAKKNWWSRSGVPESMPVGEPGGPDSEIFYEFTDVEHDPKYGPHCHPNCDCGRFLEIGNSVFMQYRKEEDGSFSKLPKPNVDFGGGLERVMMAVANTPDIVAVCHRPILEYVEQTTGKTYGADEKETHAFRVIADHIKAAVFLIADGVYPSNTDQGYFVRRLLRRAVRYADSLGMTESTFADVVQPVVDMYAVQYPALREKIEDIKKNIDDEEKKFRDTLRKGLREFTKYLPQLKFEGKEVPSDFLFNLHSTYGFPVELSLEELNRKREEAGFGPLTEAQQDRMFSEYEKKMKEHQEKSRAGSEQKFKGGLADASETTTMLHTCTHLMLAGLRKYLGDHVHQAGSNITAERARFDFTHPEKVSREVLDQVEAYVNEAIQKGCIVTTRVMGKEEAKEAGVEGSFWEKYPDKVTVYSIEASDGTVYSQELCGGPHVEGTDTITGVFKIKKESSSSAGVRRVKAVLVTN
jgi:alanyl-tRNA synthetase